MAQIPLSYSPLARRVGPDPLEPKKHVRDPQRGVPRDPWGFLLHTTGGGVTARAKKIKRRPIEVALHVYISSQNGSNGYFWGGPAYVIDHDGTTYQIAPDNILTAHCGGKDRPEYISGTWINKVAPAALAAWHAQWGRRYKHPYQLFPSKNPNNEFVGAEMIPVGDGFGGEPMAKGLRFTKAQHDAAIDLARDLAARHQWPAGWQKTPRLVGHEDVQLLERMDKGGGWDPGSLRARPYFDFSYVRHGI